MAVYERIWRRWQGRTTSLGLRWLVFSRYAMGQAFSSRAFLAFYCLCCLPTLIALVIVYALNSTAIIELLRMQVGAIDPWLVSFLRWIFLAQAIPAYLLAVILGPALVAPDLADNALPLYLSRPITRRDYVLGKLAVLVILTAPVTWVGSLLVLFLQSALHGGSWWLDNIRLITGHLVGHLVWILVVGLLSLAVAALVRYKPVARGILLGQLLILWACAGMINNIFKTSYGSLIDLRAIIQTVVVDIFVPSAAQPIPAWSGWLMLVLVGVGSVLLLGKKLVPHEVVR
jgi:ABC-2 type transport system permease protein